MDPEKTAPYELGTGDDACLLLHGFTGSPWDMKPLGESLAARGYYVRAIRLPGHGSTPEALGSVSYRDWEQAAEDALVSLSNFRQIYVAGLSMGALLGLVLASRHPERVHGLALMAPAMRFQNAAMRMARRLRRLPVLELAVPFIKKTGTDLSDPEERASAPVLPGFPSSKLHDLWAAQDRAQQALPLVRAPALIAVASQDHVVDNAGGRELARALTAAPLVRFIRIEEGFHIMPRDRGREVLSAEVGAFFDRLRQGG
jgi:carboxylesterase